MFVSVPYSSTRVNPFPSTPSGLSEGKQAHVPGTTKLTVRTSTSGSSNPGCCKSGSSIEYVEQAQGREAYIMILVLLNALPRPRYAEVFVFHVALPVGLKRVSTVMGRRCKRGASWQKKKDRFIGAPTPSPHAISSFRSLLQVTEKMNRHYPNSWSDFITSYHKTNLSAELKHQAPNNSWSDHPLTRNKGVAVS